MLHGEFRREKRSGHVVIAVFYLHLQFWIGDARLREITFPVGTAREKSAAATAAGTRPVPAAATAAGVVVDLVFAELKLVVIVFVDQRGVGAAHGRSFGIALRVFLEQIVGVAAKTRVNAAGGKAATTLEFSHELTEVHAQVGFDQIVFAQAGEIGDALRHRGFLAGAKFRAFEKGGAVFALRVFAGFVEEAGKVGGAILQDLVIPGDCGVARQIVNVRAVVAGGERDG